MLKVKVNNTLDLDYDLTSKKIMGRVGVEAIGIIKRRTERGKDHKGRAFKRYSTSPYLETIDQGGRPGGNTAKMRKHYNSAQKWTKKKRKDSTAKYVWMVQGYAQYRIVQGRSLRPNLTFTGLMMKGLHLKKVTVTTALIGFRGEQARKAYYHNISGAGGAGTKRIFQRISKTNEITRMRKIITNHIYKETKKK